MKITPFYEPESGTWTYLLADISSGKAAIIDPVWVYDLVSGVAQTAFIDEVLAASDSQGCRVEWVLETHAHADHLSAAAHIRKLTGAKIAIGRGICAVQETFIKIFNLKDVPIDGSQFDRLLAEGDVVRLGNLDIGVMETPGHTSDSLTYLCRDVAFIGDTLFAPDFGSARCDFPGGDAALLFDSISRVHALPPDTRLHLCHNYPPKGEAPKHEMSVADSLRLNIHAKEGTSREAFIEMRTNRDAQLSLPKLIFPSLLVNIRAGEAPPPENNGASYLRTPFNVSVADLIAGLKPIKD